MRLARQLLLIALLAVLVGVASGCGKSSDDTTASDEGGSGSTSDVLGTTAGPPDASPVVDGGGVVFGLEAEPEGLDPTRYAFSSSGHFVASAVFDPLFALDEEANAEPYLATAAEHDEDFTTWTLTIPEGVVFHDGTPLTAQVVVDNLAAYQESYITAASFQTVTSITAPDPTHVVIDLSESFVDFPSILTTQPGYIIAPAMLADPNLVNQPIGTGPFVFDGHEPNASWSFIKNEQYWREGLPHLDTIEYRPIIDNRARFDALEFGDIDMMNTRAPAEITALRESDYKLVENASGEEDFLVLNTSKPPFDNPTARQAVAAATDAARWIAETQDGIELPANGPFAPGQLGYLEDNGYPAFDLERAKQLVQQYQDETGQPLTFELVTQADVNVVAESQLFTSMWEAAGMQVTVTAIPQINLIAQVSTGSYQMGRFRLFSMANPDVDAQSFWRSGSIQPPPNISLNFPQYADPVVDDAIVTAIGSSDEATRQDAYETINRQFAENVPYLWLGRTVWMLAANPRVNGIYAAKNGTVETIGAKPWIAELWVSG